MSSSMQTPYTYSSLFFQLIIPIPHHNLIDLKSFQFQFQLLCFTKQLNIVNNTSTNNRLTTTLTNDDDSTTAIISWDTCCGRNKRLYM